MQTPRIPKIDQTEKPTKSNHESRLTVRSSNDQTSTSLTKSTKETERVSKSLSRNISELASTSFTNALEAAPLREYKSRTRLQVKICEIVQFIDSNIATSQKLNDEQIALIAEIFIDEYPVESLEDIAKFSRMAIRRQFKERHNFAMLDAGIIFDWFAEYLDIKYTEKMAVVNQNKPTRDDREVLLLDAAQEQEEVSEEMKAKTKALRDALFAKLDPHKRKEEEYQRFRRNFIQQQIESKKKDQGDAS